MGKNIVIFCDGTGQIGGKGSNTNVYKLFNMVEDRTPNQIAYYDPGIGTDYKKVTGQMFGKGLTKNLLECYEFIFENFEASDKIYLFGFSRGAATVRSLSGFIHLFGILPKSRPDLIEQAFSIYKKKDKKTLAKAFINKHHTMWSTIEFIGVWDTVAALGLPSGFLNMILDPFIPNQFHDFGLSPSINYARQALSIDERRKIFSPILWDTPKEKGSENKIIQMWFCGVHTDVGGGYPEDDLSNISLKWMLDEAMSFGLLIYKKSSAYTTLMNYTPNPNGEMHNEIKGIGKLYKAETRKWNTKTRGTPTIHESVLKRTQNSHNTDEPKYDPWVLKLPKN